jgi:hypothetical protein
MENLVQKGNPDKEKDFIRVGDKRINMNNISHYKQIRNRIIFYKVYTVPLDNDKNIYITIDFQNVGEVNKAITNLDNRYVGLVLKL